MMSTPDMHTVFSCSFKESSAPSMHAAAQTVVGHAENTSRAVGRCANHGSTTRKRFRTMVFVQKLKTRSFDIVLRRTMVFTIEKRHRTMVFEEKMHVEQAFAVNVGSQKP